MVAATNSRTHASGGAGAPDLFILAGEPSGDMIGGDLLSQLAARQRLEVAGVGGEQMQAAGLSSLYDMADLSVMGFADVLSSLPKLLWRLHQTVQAILRQRPEVVVLIDAQVFSHMIARRLRRRGFGGRILLYVAPTVWAWRPQRAAHIRPLYDEVMAVLPFEPKVMADLGGPTTTYVGHPALAHYSRDNWFTGERGRLALLPGSRSGELRRHLPLMKTVAEAVASHEAVSGFVLPTLSSLAPALQAEVSNWSVPVEVVSGAEARATVLKSSIAALASAGTVSLELALAGVPSIGIYVPDPAQMRVFERAGRPNVLLPNIVLGEQVVPEIVPGEDYAQRALASLRGLLDEPKLRNRQREGFIRLAELMQNGVPGHKKKDAADRVLFHLNT